MKPKTVLKSLDDRSREVVEPEPGRPAPDNLESIPASLPEPRYVPLPIREPERSYSEAYRHWGLNE